MGRAPPGPNPLSPSWGRAACGRNAGGLPLIIKKQYDRRQKYSSREVRGARNTALTGTRVSGKSTQKGKAAHPSQETEKAEHRPIKSMSIQFLRGNPQAPKGHAIFIARHSTDPRQVLWTYCVAPPIPLSLAKYLPPIMAAQISPEDIQGMTNVTAMPIPPMMEDDSTLENMHMMADKRDDDLCDIGMVNPHDIGGRAQLAQESSQAYGQLYMDFINNFQHPSKSLPDYNDEPAALDDLDAEELLLQTMTDRQRMAELSKLVGLTRYALEGKDTHLIEETRQRMQRLARPLPDKYRTSELITAAANPQDRGSRLAELYIERGYKLLDEEYADIPNIEQAIRKLQEQ